MINVIIQVTKDEALYEVIPVDNELAGYIKENNNEVQQVLKNRGINNLANRALEVLTEGETSLEEVYALLTGY